MLRKIYEDRVKPLLSTKEQSAMEKALEAVENEMVCSRLNRRSLVIAESGENNIKEKSYE